MRKFQYNIQYFIPSLACTFCLLVSSATLAQVSSNHSSHTFNSHQYIDLWTDTTGFPITDQPRGTSTASMVIQGSVALFSGELNPITTTAYSSYRLQKLDFSAWNLRETDEVSFVVVGDGRKYRFLLKDIAASQSVTDYSFQAEFQTAPGVREEIHIKISSLKPYFRGVKMPDDVTLDSSQVVQWGFQVTDTTQGVFRLLIETKKAL